jgi:dolichyl-phosphate-mannose--protein O-mannosyl transferase
VRKVVGDSSYAWTFLGFCFHWDSLYFVCRSLFLFVDRSLLHIVSPYL